MSSLLLIVFVLMLVVALLYSFRFPPLVLVIAIATYGLKQIASATIPILQIYNSIFNLILGAVVIFVFLYGMVTRSLPGCRSTSGKHAMAFLWGFLGLFWVSLIWSPFSGSDSLRFLPYLLVYFAILPYLMGNPNQMIKAFRILWVILFVGCLGLLFSPYLDLANTMGRMVVKFHSGTHEEGNPLALADTGIYLLLISLMIIFDINYVRKAPKFIKSVVSIFGLVGIGLGFRIASVSSRGETFAGVISGCLLIFLLKIKNVRQKKILLASAIALTMMGIIFTAALWNDYYQDLSPRYSKESLGEGTDIRKDLVTNAINLALASPQTILVGIGARGCEERLGMYPHNNLAQAFSETGIIGFSLLFGCYFLAFRFGLRTLAMAKKQSNQEVVLFVSLLFSLLLYDLILENKRGSLTFVDTYMWLALAIFAFDHAQASLSRRLQEIPPMGT